jgi:hypothetical protein
VRGRRSANLYRRTVDDALLATRVRALRRALRLDAAVGSARAGEVLAFASWSAAGVATLALTVVVTLAPVWLLVALLAR